MPSVFGIRCNNMVGPNKKPRKCSSSEEKERDITTDSSSSSSSVGGAEAAECAGGILAENEGKELKHIFDILIPTDVTKLIFDRLDRKDLMEARLVSKGWAEMIDSTISWKPYLYDNGIDKLKPFIEKGLPIDELHVSKLHDFKYPDEGMGFTKVRSIHFLPYLNRGSNAKWKQRGISTANLKNLLLELNNIEEIRLHSMALNDVEITVFETAGLPMLKELEISTLDTDGPGYHVCLAAVGNTFPSLVKFKALIFFDVDGENVEHPPCYIDVFQFCIRHKDTLRSLHLDYNAGGEEPTPAELSEDHRMTPEEFLKLNKELAYVQLKELILSPSYYEGTNRFTFGNTLLECQTNLVVLNVQNLHRCNRSMWTVIQGVITKCSNTLATIMVHGCFCPAAVDGIEEHYSCVALKNCHQLTHLQLSVCGIRVHDIQYVPFKLMQTLEMNLDREQLELISRGDLKQLRFLTVRPSNKSDDSLVPCMTFPRFLAILQHIPKLQNLIIYPKSTEWKKIRKFIVKTEGLKLSKFDEDEELNIGPKFQLIRIDRKRFHYQF